MTTNAQKSRHLLAVVLAVVPIYGIALINGWQSFNQGFEMPSGAASLANVLFMLVAFGGLQLALLYFVSRQTLSSLTLKAGTWPMDLLDGLGLAGVLLATQMVINLLMYRPDSVPPANQQIAASLASDPVLMLIWAGPVIWLQAAVLEEFTRVFILSRLWQVWPRHEVKLAVLAVSSVVFGLGHIYQGWMGVLATALIGFVLGYYYLRRGRVLPMILAHGLYNSVVLMFLVLAARNGLFDG